MIYFILVLIFIASFIIYMWKEAFRNFVRYHTLSFKEFPESFGEYRIFFISDIHRREIDDSIIKEVKDQANIVIIGGDLTEKNVPLYRTYRNIEKLKKIGRVFFVWGNNDYEVDSQMLESLLLDWGVEILTNRHVSIFSKEGESFAIIGIDDISMERDRLDQALYGVKDPFRLFITHNPEGVKLLNDEHNIQLVLAGHTHGGQINVFGLGLYRKGRIYRQGNITVLISNGYGTTLLPFRFGAKAETHLITIKHKNCKN